MGAGSACTTRDGGGGGWLSMQILDGDQGRMCGIGDTWDVECALLVPRLAEGGAGEKIMRGARRS